MDKSARCCRNCRHYALDRVLSANGRVLKNRVGMCNWKMPEGWQWPASMRGHHQPRTSASHMAPMDGTDCGTFTPYTTPGSKEKAK